MKRRERRKNKEGKSIIKVSSRAHTESQSFSIVNGHTISQHKL